MYVVTFFIMTTQERRNILLIRLIQSSPLILIYQHRRFGLTLLRLPAGISRSQSLYLSAH
jgi:hypothetical protein